MQPDQSQPPAVPPTQPTNPAPVAQQPGEDPGKTLGIVGLVLTVLGLGLIGLVLGIIGMIKSKKAGFTNVFAIITVVLNAILLLVVLPVLLLLVLTTFSNVQDRAKSSASKTYAASTIAQVEAFHANSGTYPSSLSEFKKDQSTQLSPEITFSGSDLNSEPAKPGVLAFYICGRPNVAAGVKVGYWDYDAHKVVYRYSPYMDEKSVCTLSAS